MFGLRCICVTGASPHIVLPLSVFDYYVLFLMTSVITVLAASNYMEADCKEIRGVEVGERVCPNVRCCNGNAHICPNCDSILVLICVNNSDARAL